MLMKPSVGQRVECTRNITDHLDPKTVIIKKGEKGEVVSTRGPAGIDVKWDKGLYCPIDKRDIKKI